MEDERSVLRGTPGGAEQFFDAAREADKLESM